MTAHGHGHGAEEESSLFATAHGHGADEEASPFAELMAQVMASAERFGHRQHVHLTWLAVRRYGTAGAVGLVSDGIQRTARYAGVPQKYHATVSWAWVELVGHHAAHGDAASFDAFASQHPALLDKKLLTRFYRPATLASTPARTGWVEPDLAPFPWQQTARLVGRNRPATAGEPVADAQGAPRGGRHPCGRAGAPSWVATNWAPVPADIHLLPGSLGLHIGSEAAWSENKLMQAATTRSAAAVAAVIILTAALPASAGVPHFQTVTLCRPYQVKVINGYVARNDVFRPSPQSPPAQECITSNIIFTSFQITKILADSPHSVAYPSIYYGCQYGRCSQQSALPAVVGNLPRLTLTACYDYPPAGRWNAGTDMWFTPTRQTNGHPLGAEMMLWFAYRGFRRRGQDVTIDHARWLAYERLTNSGGVTKHPWPLIIFRKITPIRSGDCAWHLPLAPFFRYAEARQWMATTMWLESINAGFELWDYAISNGQMNLTSLRIWPRGTSQHLASRPGRSQER